MSTNKPPPEYIDPLELDDDKWPPAQPATTLAAIPTGLSEEEDAGRHLALKFNRNVGFCINCEGLYDLDDEDMGLVDGNFEPIRATCPVCDSWLETVGTKPLKRKR